MLERLNLMYCGRCLEVGIVGEAKEFSECQEILECCGKEQGNPQVVGIKIHCVCNEKGAVFMVGSGKGCSW